jgi:Protein of unknown function (DUF2442)
MHKFNIEDAHYQNDYKILLAFDDGAEGVVDLKDFIFDKNCGVFKRLQNQEQFKNFALENHTLVWGNDLDLAPEFLHQLLTNKTTK